MKKKILAGALAICMISSQLAFALTEPYQETASGHANGTIGETANIDTLGQDSSHEQINSFLPEHKNDDGAFFSADLEQRVKPEHLEQKTDRYIVKYKKESNKHKMKLKKHSEFEVKETKPYSSGPNQEQENDYGLIITSEPVNKEAFMLELKQMNQNEIEYIQPDYKMELSTLDKTELSDPAGQNILDDMQADETMSPEPEGIPTPDEFITETQSPSEERMPIDESFEIEETVKDQTDIVVAVIDTGIDITHEALKDAIWSNPNEMEDGFDTDYNKYADDVHGWDFVNKANTIYQEGLGMEQTHGTHIAGVIAGNSESFQGVAPGTKIMPLKAFENGSAYTSDIIEAIHYAQMMGADIVNCSFGTSEENLALKEAIQNSDMLFVCAAGNSAKNTDESPVYPACYQLDNVISAASVNDRDFLSYFSNYGQNIEITANGRNIYGPLPDHKYGNITGTSMSAAYISGAAAAVMSHFADKSAVFAKEQLLKTANTLAGLDGKISGARRVNLQNALDDSMDDTVLEPVYENYEEEQSHSLGLSNDYQLYTYYYPQIRNAEAGGYHSIAQDSGGCVYTFGNNKYGQMGMGTMSDEGIIYDTTIDSVIGIYNVSKISTRGDHNLACENKTVWTWGRNDYGQLGNGNRASQPMAVQVQSLSNIVDVAAGHQFSLALDEDGAVYAWGHNGYGQVGNGTSDEYYHTPVRVNISGVKKISAGQYHALAIKEDGTVWGWGRNMNGALGNTDSEVCRTPVQIPIEHIEQITAGFNNSFFLTAEGEVYASGSNEYGQFGDGTLDNRPSPSIISGITDVKQVASNSATIFLKKNGEAYGAGLNHYGQLGQGNTKYRIETITKIPGSGYSKVSAGGRHTLLFVDEKIVGYDESKTYAMGSNQYYQCGDKSGVEPPQYIVYPQEVHFLSGIDDDGETVPSTELLPHEYNKILLPVADTYVSQNGISNTENYADSRTLSVNYTRSENGTSNWGQYAYLKFDTSGIKKDMVLEAKLWVYVDQSSDARNSERTISLFDTQWDDWQASSITWTEGRIPSGTTEMGSFTVKGNGSVIVDHGWREIDVTSALMHDSDDTLSVMAKMTSTTAHPVLIRSMEHDAAGTRPQLVVKCEKSYTWEHTSAGGGGGMFLPKINPYDTDMLTVSCDMRGNYFSYDSGQSFSMMPLDNRIYASHIASENTMYLGGNLLYKSMDKGKTVTQVYPRPEDIAVISKRGAGQTPYYAVKDKENKVHKRIGQFHSITTSPLDENVLFFLFHDDELKQSDLYMSTDGGANCAKIKTFESIDAEKLYADANHTNTLYLIYDKGVKKLTVDLQTLGEASVQEIYTKDTETITDGVVHYNADTGENEFYLIEPVSQAVNQFTSHVYRYTEDSINGQPALVNGGSISDNLTDAFTNQTITRTLSCIDIAANGTVAVGYGTAWGIFDIDTFGVVTTADEGLNWQVFEEKKGADNRFQMNNYGYLQDRQYHGNSPLGLDICSVDPDTNTETDAKQEADIMMMYTTSVSTFLTKDGGSTWNQLENTPLTKNGESYHTPSKDSAKDKYAKSTGLDVTNINTLTFDPDNPNKIIMGLMDIGSFLSTDGGETWINTNYELPVRWHYNSYGSIYLPNREILLSIWTSVHDLPIKGVWNNAKKPQSESGDENGIPIYAYSTSGIVGGISISQDDGVTQEELESALPSDIVPLAVKYLRNKEKDCDSIYICTYGHGIYRFDLTEQVLALSDNELIAALNTRAESKADPIGWQEINPDIQSAQNTNPALFSDGFEENIAEQIDEREPIYISEFRSTDGMLFGQPLAEEAPVVPTKWGNNVYAGEITADAEDNLYAVITNPMGEQAVEQYLHSYVETVTNENGETEEITKYEMWYRYIKTGAPNGGVYRSTDGGDTWELLSIPQYQENNRVPSTVAFDKDGAMYVGFLTVYENSPNTHEGGGVWKLPKDSTEWEQILGETYSINDLCYDRITDRMVIAGNTMELLYYRNGEVKPVEGYDFPTTNRVFVNNGNLYACSGGGGLWIGTPAID